MAQKSHEWPKPMFRNGAVYYAASQSDWDLHALTDPTMNRSGVEPYAGYGWSGKYEHQEFPKALHGPDEQSLSVKNAKELKAALSNGWSVTRIHEPVTVETVEVATPYKPPRPAKAEEATE